ncbi:MAG: carboxypeptidase regulatory-like domain-containing protein [Deltaproteobacteria bacterium]|nr:carboxypeptidase regulatory-like domain-containing protein [Candidatus Anaeroferrophillus wilburensis]MBN2889279.1 carboxypeptidase regulatory-like domain-containing protein [Deltaproteobacteria bacterium]
MLFDPVADQHVLEEQELAFTVHAQSSSDEPLTYSASNLPAGATFNPDTQVFSWTPVVGQAGSYQPEFRVTDGDITASMTVTIIVSPNPPVVSLTADPLTVDPGQPTTLTWTSSYADTVTIEPGIGLVATSGSVMVSPAATTTYTTTATGPGGSVSDAITIVVNIQATAVTAIGIISDGQSGEPLAGVNVSITDAEKTQSTITLSDGSYAIYGITPGSATITASLEGYTTGSWQTIYDEPGIWKIDFALHKESALSMVMGTIVNSTSLEPEAGVTITLGGTDNACVTAADGTFALDDVPYGQQTLYITQENTQNTFITLLIDKNPYELDLAVPYRNGRSEPAEINTTVTGIIQDGITGWPIAWAMVKVIGTSIEAVTNQDGQFSLADLPTGDIMIMAMALNHEAVAVVSHVVTDASETLTFNLAPTTSGTIVGTVIDAVTGEPVRNARIGIGEGVLAGAQTEADGTYTMLTVPVGDYTVSASHPGYLPDQQSFIAVEADEPATVDFTLTPRPQTGSLEGMIFDKESGKPLSNVVITNQETGAVATTNAQGYYLLNNLPAGLVTLQIAAFGYPATSRVAAVDADVDEATPTATSYDIALDQADPAPPDTISALVTAAAGGTIESPDKRFMMVIPPGALSADAIITLMPPTTGPVVDPGDSLTLDPQLGDPTVAALGEMIQIAVEPAIDGAEIPTINNWVVLAGRYFQSTVDALNLDESTVFPYYWDGTHWTLMQIKPYDFAVDEINNRHVAAVNFSTTAFGDPVAVDLSTKKPILLASLNDYIPNITIAHLYLFVQASSIIYNHIFPPPNAYIYDKDELTILDILGPEKEPNANALPILMLHGWDGKAIFYNQGHTDPNIEQRYKYMVEDIALATNGVYRPMFGTYNPRAGIVETGNSLATTFAALDVKGLPSDTHGSTGSFPYFDTFGFSMGGIVSRTLQARNRGVHNMVMAATPNHGTFFMLDELNTPPMTAISSCWSPGTWDLFPYDDRSWISWLSGNPTLYNLNRSSSCMPQANMTMIAGTKGILASLLGDNDKVVPVDSVFCRTTADNDGDKSLLRVNASAKKFEYRAEFDHFEFSTDEYRLRDNPEVYDPIQQGFSDWVVGKSILSAVTFYDDNVTINSAACEVEVQYNVWNEDIDRVVLVIYAMDQDYKWHLCGTSADKDGNVIDSAPIDGNSIELAPLQLHDSAHFAEEARIWRVTYELIPLAPGQTTVPLVPSANFTLPDN